MFTVQTKAPIYTFQRLPGNNSAKNTASEIIHHIINLYITHANTSLFFNSKVTILYTKLNFTFVIADISRSYCKCSLCECFILYIICIFYIMYVYLSRYIGT